MALSYDGELRLNSRFQDQPSDDHPVKEIHKNGTLPRKQYNQP